MNNTLYYVFGILMICGLLTFIVGTTGFIFNPSVWWFKRLIFGLFIYLVFERLTKSSKEEDKTN